MQIFSLILALLAASALLTPQTVTEKILDDKQKKIRQLVDSADSLPIEFRADIQLEAIESGAFPQGEPSKDVLENLIQSASTAKNPYPLRRAFLTADSMENDLADATGSFVQLDALSVQTRAISALAKIDRTKALVALRDIHVQIPPIACSSALIPDVSKFYGMLDSLALVTFSPVEKRKGEDFVWYEDNVRGMNSALQLVPVADFIMRSPLTNAQFEQLSDTFAAALTRLRATDREVTWLYAEDSLSKAVLKLAGERKNKNLSIDALFLGYRQFLLHSSDEARCGDQTANWRNVVSEFNRGRDLMNVGERVPTLSADDVEKNSSQGERAQTRNIPELKEFYSLWAKIYALYEKSGPRATPVQLQADTENWESDAAELLTKIDEYDPTKENCVECADIAKTRLLQSFFEVCPDDTLKRKILSRLVRVLVTSPLQTKNPVLWLYRMNALLNLARKPTDEQVKQLHRLAEQGYELNLLPNSMGNEIRDEMKRSGDYTMYLYVDADEIFETKYYSPYIQ